jgi:hypothetical protein
MTILVLGIVFLLLSVVLLFAGMRGLMRSRSATAPLAAPQPAAAAWAPTPPAADVPPPSVPEPRAAAAQPAPSPPEAPAAPAPRPLPIGGMPAPAPPPAAVPPPAASASEPPEPPPVIPDDGSDWFAAAPPEPDVAAPPATAPGDVATTIEPLPAVPRFGTLVGMAGGVEGRTFPVEEGGFFVGRDETLSQVIVDDPRVSKRHVWIGVREGNVVAVDQGSTNGTFVNSTGERITERVLRPGDVVILANDAVRLRFDI